MARGRHVKRSGLLSRLWPRRSRYVPVARYVPAGPPAADDRLLLDLQAEVARLRVLGIAHAAAAASADVRARRAEEQVQALRTELDRTRDQLGAVREELLWAFAEGRLPVAAAEPVAGTSGVIDLRAPGSRTA